VKPLDRQDPNSKEYSNKEHPHATLQGPHSKRLPPSTFSGIYQAMVIPIPSSMNQGTNPIPFCIKRGIGDQQRVEPIYRSSAYRA